MWIFNVCTADMLYRAILFDKVIIRVCIAMIRVYVFVLVHQAILAIYMKGHPSLRVCGVFLSLYSNHESP